MIPFRTSPLLPGAAVDPSVGSWSGPKIEKWCWLGHFRCAAKVPLSKVPNPGRVKTVISLWGPSSSPSTIAAVIAVV